MNVVNLDAKKDKKTDQRKKEMLDVLDEIKKQVESGEIEEFVACSQSSEHGIQIHASCLDAIGGIGLFEVGKQLLIDYEIKN